MSPLLASTLLFDTDNDNLFEVDEIACGVWVSARVYKSIKANSIDYEVWFYEWFPGTDEEKVHFIQSFQDLEEAKKFAIQLSKNKEKINSL